MGTRRRFTPEYRRDVASLVLDTGSSIASVARDLRAGGIGGGPGGSNSSASGDQAVREGRPDPREMEAEMGVFNCLCIRLLFKGLMHDE